MARLWKIATCVGAAIALIVPSPAADAQVSAAPVSYTLAPRRDPSPNNFSSILGKGRIKKKHGIDKSSDDEALAESGRINGGSRSKWGAGRYTVMGASMVGAGVGVYAGTLAAVGIWGTASTGTAIASLSGVAATNATYAFLGGGAVAAGGGGVMAGAAVMTGGIVAVVAAAGAGIYYLWHLSDERAEMRRIRFKAEQFSDPKILDNILNSREGGFVK